MRSLVAQESFYLTILYVAMAIWIIPEWIGGFIQRSEETAAKRDRGSLFVLIGGLMVGIFLAFLFVNRFPAATIAWNQPLWFWLGIVLMLAGVAFRWYAIRALGKYFSRDVATRADQAVVETGPYRWIRHPSYSGALVTVFGLGLALTNWASLCCILLFTFIGYFYRVRVEERALCEALGEPYRQYMRRTRRFIPFIW